MPSMPKPTPRMPNPIYPLETDESGDPGVLNCQICNEPADAEMGEFMLPHPCHAVEVFGAVLYSVVAHGQCGLDHGLESA